MVYQERSFLWAADCVPQVFCAGLQEAWVFGVGYGHEDVSPEGIEADR